MREGGERADISVVVPLYNKAPFIRECLDSIGAQSLLPLEVIVVDDGSGDGGAELVEDWAATTQRPKARLIRQANAGVSVARNRGLQEAAGSFVALLDADDLWEPTFLEEAWKAIGGEPGADAVFGHIIERGKGVERVLLPSGSHPREVPDYPSWFMGHRGYGLWSSNTLVRKSLLLDIGGFPAGVQNGEDTDTWFRLGFRANVRYAPAARAVYRRVDSASLSRRFRAVEPLVISTITRLLAGGEVPPSQRQSAERAIHYFRAGYALALAQEGQRGKALRSLLSSSLGAGRVWFRALAALLIGK